MFDVSTGVKDLLLANITGKDHIVFVYEILM